MDIETKVELTFNVRLREDEMDLLATVLYAAMIYKEDAMDGAAEDALISAMKALPEDKLFYVGNRIQRGFAHAPECPCIRCYGRAGQAKWDAEDST